jgi:hypothetical protein
VRGWDGLLQVVRGRRTPVLRGRRSACGRVSPLVSLFANGRMRTDGSAGAGQTPPPQEPHRSRGRGVRRQVEPVPLIGEEHEKAVLRVVAEADARNPGPMAGAPTAVPVDVVEAHMVMGPSRLLRGPSGRSASTTHSGALHLRGDAGLSHRGHDDGGGVRRGYPKHRGRYPRIHRLESKHTQGIQGLGPFGNP